jgi:hypothetical protein
MIADGKKLLIVTGGRIKVGAFDLAFPTGIDYEFPNTWKDLGALSDQPSLEQSVETKDIPFFNLDPVTITAAIKWILGFTLSQLDKDTLKFAFGFGPADENGAVRPGKTTFEGQIAAYLTTATEDIMIHVPNAKVTSMGKIDFLKNDAGKIPFTVACNPDSRLEDNAPWQWFSTGDLLEPAVVTG